MKQKIDFTKLLTEEYHNFNLDIELEMVNWFLSTGLGYEISHGWSRCGINQLIYGYSFNNEDHHAPAFPIEGLRSFLTSIFVRAIVSPRSWDGFGKISEWREKNNIGMGKYRVLKFPDKNENDPYQLLHRISGFKGKELKKKYAQPEYPDRTQPKIISVTFSTYGEGYFVNIMFSFLEYNYEPGWTIELAKQKEGEYIGDFLARAEKKLKAITVRDIS